MLEDRKKRVLQAIVEEYIEGEEYSIEGISFKGKHKFLAITKKFTTGAPNFIETGHIVNEEIITDKQIIIFTTGYVKEVKSV